MTPEMERVIEKIRKILKLSQNNPSEKEALAAARMARSMLAKYSLSMEDVEKTEAEVVRENATETKKFKRWELFLAHTMSEYVPVRHIILMGWNKTRTIQFIGERGDAIVAVEMFRYLRSVIMKMASENFPSSDNNGSTKLLKKSYALGAVERLQERFIAMKAEDKKQVDSLEGKYELMVVSKLAVVDSFMAEKLKLHMSRSRAINVFDFAREKGYNDADGISLYRQINSGGNIPRVGSG